MKQQVDIIASGAHALTMEGPGVGYEADWAVVVNNGEIIDTGPKNQMLATYEAKRRLGGDDFLLMPGLVDAHMHTSLAIFRGLAQDTGLWMHRGIGPWIPALTPEGQYYGARVVTAEAVLSGSTTLFDCSEPMGRIAGFFEEIGVRAVVSTRIAEVPPVKHKLRENDLYPFDPELGRARFEEAKQLAADWHGAANGRITHCYAPQCLDQISLELLEEVWEEARRADMRVMFHTAQSSREHVQMELRYGKRTIPMMAELGYLDERLIAVHLTDANDDEVKMIAESGASMVYCPSSIAITGGRVPPAHLFKQAGGVVGLGTDQAAGNNAQSVWAEMKIGALLQKTRFTDPEVFPAGDVLRMATIDGARAIGLGDTVGSLRRGKRADFLLVDLNEPSLTPRFMTPVRNLVPNLVYSARGGEVHTVVIDGKVIVENRSLQTVDLATLIAEVNAVAADMGQQIAAKGDFTVGVLAEQMQRQML